MTWAESTSSIRVTGPLLWGHYVVRCGECGTDTDLQLLVGPAHGAVGELAWLRCPAGHDTWHCLVYPKMVRAVLDWATRRADPDRPPLLSVVERLPWWPHRMHHHDPTDTDMSPTVFWIRWGPAQWQSAAMYDPELAAAHADMERC